MKLVFKWLAFVVCWAVVGVLLESCGKALQANSEYAAQREACVVAAKTKDGGLQCLASVDRAWGLDGGAE